MMSKLIDSQWHVALQVTVHTAVYYQLAKYYVRLSANMAFFGFIGDVTSRANADECATTIVHWGHHGGSYLGDQ